MTRHLALLIVLFAAGSLHGQIPPASAGVADLSRHDFNQDTSFELNGTWQWFPGVFLSDGPSAVTAQLVKVPGRVFLNNKQEAHGWGTYRLEVLVPEALVGGKEPCAIRVPIIASSSRIWWNGSLIAEAGNTSQSAESQVGGWISSVRTLGTVAARNELLVEVSNFHDFYTGISQPFEFGFLGTLERNRNERILVEMILFGSLFFMGFYHLGFWFYRRKDRSLLYFGLSSILLAIRPFFYNDVYLLELFPTLPWDILMKGGYLTFSLPALTFGLFIYWLFPEEVFHKTTLKHAYRNLVLIPTVAYSVLIVLFPVSLFSMLLIWFQGYIIIIGASIIAVLINAIRMRQNGGWLFLVGFFLFFITIGNDIVRSNNHIETPFLSSLGLVIFLCFQSIVIIQRYSVSLKLAEDRNIDLNQMNQSLQRFIPREVLGFLKKKNIQDISLGEHTRSEMTVLYTKIPEEKANDLSSMPDVYFSRINSYLKLMNQIVRKHQGFVDKYLENGVLALFPEKPEDALRAAIEISALTESAESPRAASGIHYGSLLIGTIGEYTRMDSIIISESVIIAQRLQELGARNGQNLLCSDETLAALKSPGEFQFVALPDVLVKGRELPVRVFGLERLTQP